MRIMKHNIYLYIVWQKGRAAEDRIRTDLARHYRIIKEYEVRWPWYQSIRNFCTFYRHIAFFSWLRKCWICGTGAFRLILVEDSASPDAKTADRQAVSLKGSYRTWAGRRWRVHGSASLEETRYQYWLLTGKTLEQLLAEPADKEVERLDLRAPLRFDLRLLERIGS